MTRARKFGPKVNYERLAELHEEHLQTPVTPAHYDRAVESYVKAVKLRDELAALTAKKTKEQKRLAARKRAMQERHRAMRGKIKEQEDAMFAAVGAKHYELREAAAGAEDARRVLSEAAENLVRVHGSAPITIDGVTHDFGCYGSKVYLVPRVKTRKR